MRTNWTRARVWCLVAACTTIAPIGVVAQEPAAPRPAPADDKPTDKPKKLSMDLRVTPAVSFAPARVRAVAELKLPEARTADFYCASIEWDWGDMTESEESNECEPYEPGVSAVKTRFTAEHVFQTGGRYRVQLRLRRNRKVLHSTSTIVTVRPGVRDQFGQPEP